MRGIASYQSNQKKSASPSQIVLMLLQTVVQSLTRCSEAEAAGSSAWYRDLHHAREIFLELKMGLDFDAAPALCTRLARLYDWSMAELVRAGRERSTQPILSVLRSTIELLEGWNHVIYADAP